MRVKILTILGASILILTAVGFYIFNNESKALSDNKAENIKKFDDVYSSEINKSYDGSYLDKIVTMVDAKEKFNIKINDINKDSKIILINSSNGEKQDMTYTENNEFVLTTKLDEGVNYGILMDNKLIGGIRVVNELDKADKEKIYEEVMKSLQCGI
ncbi:hypothetical protein [Clostridium botulinum]|uniref:Uncharacterized protein n=5 Tax=Clostridium botulinum TaxID=1491 RepID=A0A6B4M2X9_CLOBO|nr:hypothetical protein [Clostridium botulinum]AJD28564.1 putative exported protein [Clostridium botulinum CDC_297]EPS46191.1 hypothetical protein CFSAN002368_28614 [Clostridium botulinum A1 str. CFSAN002368]ACO86594.1 hypothetical protein CLM_0320 [Clostridium botulinum A2 str. Kyoto]ACQ51689.1 hypothetical protein CLJ_B0315 [Clostridium botulinum Ba4 str. 657]AJE12082.1 putative exported protein [Clostridium botulinum CDC_1436]